MSRRRVAAKRVINPDPLYGSLQLSKFINLLMYDGKKSVAEKIVYAALDTISKKGADEPLEVMTAALDNIKPKVEVKSRRVGGSTYQVPVEVRPERRGALAMRWLIDAARKRSERTMAGRLAGEVLDASESRGSAVKSVKIRIEWQRLTKPFHTIAGSCCVIC